MSFLRKIVNLFVKKPKTAENVIVIDWKLYFKPSFLNFVIFRKQQQP